MALTKVKLIADGTIVQSHLNASHGITTADIGEGSNLYYTDARARAAVSVSGNALSYNSSTGVITSNFEENPVFTTGVTVANDSGHFTLFRTDGVTQLGKLYDDSGFTIEGKANNNLILRTKANSLGEGIKFQDTSSNDLMFIDGTNGRVGIGETSPLGKLHVKTTDTASTANSVGNLLVLEDSENGMSILSSASGAGYILFGDSGDNDIGGILYDHSANAMRFRTNGVWDRMRIDSSGNVGINVSPTNMLSIKGTSGSNKGLDVYHSNGNKVGELVHGGTGDEGRLSLYDSNVETVRFAGENNASSFINSGNLGIGTTSPDSVLHLDGNTNSWTTSPTIIMSSSSIANANIRNWRIGPADTNYGNFHIGVSSAQGGLVDSDSEASTFTIDYTGKIGIGTISPQTLLDIHDDSPVLRISATNQSASWAVGTEIGKLEFYTTDPSGNAPYDTGFIAIENDLANGTLPSGAMVFGTATYNASGGAVERMRIDSSGRVFINSGQSWVETFIDKGLRIKGSRAGTILESGSTLATHVMIAGSNPNTAVHINHNSAGYLSFYQYSAGKETLRLHQSGGITFNGDTAAANALDDYEEGTFTPTIGDGTYTYSYRRGHYQKIGNTVYIHIGFKINTASSVGTATATISGLPFTGMSWGSYQEPMEKVVGGLFVTSNLSSHLAFFVSNSSSTLHARTTASNSDTAVSSNQLWQNGTFIKLQLQYTVS